MKVYIALVILFLSLKGISQTHDDASHTISPIIIGDTLYINGKIDSHIYDFISYESQKIETVRYVSINSFGGNHYWAMQVGRRLQELRKITIITKGSVCASACAYIFGSGTERWISENSWVGVHGARLGAGYTVDFIRNCFDRSDNTALLNETKEGCQEFLGYWYNVVFAETQLAFQLIESAGVSPDLFTTYMSLEEDLNWFQNSNILKIKDWALSPQEALHFNLATHIILEPLSSQ